MRYLDSRNFALEADPIAAVAAEPWDGERPAVLGARSTQQLFDDLEGELRGVDVLRVIDTSWLAVEEFGREIEQLVSAFRARGGRVEYPEESPMWPSKRGARPHFGRSAKGTAQ